jgi:hypothetical protein
MIVPRLYIAWEKQSFLGSSARRERTKNKARVIKDSCRTNYCYNSPAHLKIWQRVDGYSADVWSHFLTESYFQKSHRHKRKQKYVLITLPFFFLLSWRTYGALLKWSHEEIASKQRPIQSLSIHIHIHIHIHIRIHIHILIHIHIHIHIHVHVDSCSYSYLYSYWYCTLPAFVRRIFWWLRMVFRLGVLTFANFKFQLAAYQMLQCIRVFIFWGRHHFWVSPVSDN